MLVRQLLNLVIYSVLLINALLLFAQSVFGYSSIVEHMLDVIQFTNVR